MGFCVRRNVTAILFLATLSAAAQVPGTGGLLGNVFGVGTQTLANAQLVVENQSTHVTRIATTGTSGEYSIALLVHGIYTITASAPGYAHLKAENAVVVVSETNTVDCHAFQTASTTSIEVRQLPTISNSTALMQTTSLRTPL